MHLHRSNACDLSLHSYFSMCVQQLFVEADADHTPCGRMQ
jgi:hypothetical protein